MGRKRLSVPNAEGEHVPSVGEVLVGAFQMLRDRGSRVRTQEDEARFLDVSPSYLSKLRLGRQALPLDRVNDFAQRFAAGDLKLQSRLAQELERARRAALSSQLPAATTSDYPEAPPDDFVRTVESFFAKLAQPGRLLCVDYRDLPQAVSDGPYPSTARYASKAIAAGLSFAMFQPFGREEDLRALRNEAQDDHPFFHLYEYLFDLAREVRQVYREMKRSAEGARCDIALYEATPALADPTACGVQSRTFFIDYEEAGRHVTKVHEWIVGTDRHHFVERSNESIHVLAVREQFSPVSSFWSVHRRLPTRTELGKLYKERDHLKLPHARRWERWDDK